MRNATNRFSPLSLKAVGIGLLLIPLNAIWQMMGLRWDIAHMSMISLLYNTITLLFVLTVVNRLTQKVAPRLALSPAELLTIYVMLCLSTAIGGHMCVPDSHPYHRIHFRLRNARKRLALPLLALYSIVDISHR